MQKFTLEGNGIYMIGKQRVHVDSVWDGWWWYQIMEKNESSKTTQDLIRHNCTLWAKSENMDRQGTF